jgi:phosphoglycerol transferase MdoB-like AlkP superfamily enzyme
VLLVRDAALRGWRTGGLPLLLFVLCQHAMFCVAHDMYRFTCFLFVPVLLAGVRLARERSGWLLIACFGVATACLYLPQRHVFVEMSMRVLTDVDANGAPFVRPDIIGDIVPKVIPAMRWTFLGYGLALLASIAAGIAWARFDRRRSPNTLTANQGGR